MLCSLSTLNEAVDFLKIKIEDTVAFGAWIPLIINFLRVIFESFPAWDSRRRCCIQGSQVCVRHKLLPTKYRLFWEGECWAERLNSKIGHGVRWT